jgi:cellulose synthase/poly-beta-1,6-N-acetylglucosamine synthase-like glycosyltransferase
LIILKALLVLLVLYVALWAIYVLMLPIAACLSRSSTGKPGEPSSVTPPDIAVIVPAYNMKDFVARCISSLKACNYPADKVSIYVVADHCTDNTSELAIGAGASVLLREEGPRGKTYTLAWALDVLTKRGHIPDLYLIVDATARVDPVFLEALAARWMEGEDIIIGRASVDAENQQWFAQCLGLTLAHRNLQNWARERLGLSAFISGRGMAYSRRYIQKYGWSLALPTSTSFGAHPTEDWRHGVRIAAEGLRATFVEDARVFTPLRDSLRAATEQGIRWERGRMANASTDGFQLLLQGFRQRNKLKVLAALDAIQPPVAILAGLCVLTAALSVLVFKSLGGVVLGCAPLLLIILYGFAVLERGRHEGIKRRTILWAPVYVAWRCKSFFLALGFLARRKDVELQK